MATIRKLSKSGKWQAQVAKQGVRKSKTFDTKAEARDWAARQEYLIASGELEQSPSKQTVSDIFDRYGRDVSPTKKGVRWEVLRFELFKNYELGKIRLDKLGSEDIAAWRDLRLREVSPATVRREMGLMSSAFTVAKLEWKWLKENPAKDVRKPPNSKARDRLISEAEIDRLIALLGMNPQTVRGRLGLMFLFAIETAMRAGEICNLTWEHVDLATRVAHLPETKNGSSRDVPLTPEAAMLLMILENRKSTTCFDMKPSQVDANFRKYRTAAKIDDLHFHDTRHEGITRLSKKFHVLALARAIGHTDLNQLQTYYNESAADLAQMLD